MNELKCETPGYIILKDICNEVPTTKTYNRYITLRSSVFSQPKDRMDMVFFISIFMFN